jgi:hypothetical protein
MSLGNIGEGVENLIEAIDVNPESLEIFKSYFPELLEDGLVSTALVLLEQKPEE